MTTAPTPVGGTTPRANDSRRNYQHHCRHPRWYSRRHWWFLRQHWRSAGFSTGAGALLAQQAYQRLGDVGERARREASQIARQGLEQTEFKPFTVTTATGGMMGVSPEGRTTMTVSQKKQHYSSSF